MTEKNQRNVCVEFYFEPKTQEDAMELDRFLKEELITAHTTKQKLLDEIELLRKKGGYKILKRYITFSRILMFPSGLLTRILTLGRVNPDKAFKEAVNTITQEGFFDLMEEATKKWEVEFYPLEHKSLVKSFVLKQVNHPILYINWKKPEWTAGIIAVFVPHKQFKAMFKRGILGEEALGDYLLLETLELEVKDLKKRLRKNGIDAEVTRSRIFYEPSSFVS